MQPWRPCASLSHVGHSRVNMEAKGPHKLEQGLTHRHSHLEVRRGAAGEGICCVPLAHLHKGRTPLSVLASEEGIQAMPCGAWHRPARRDKGGGGVF